MTNKERVHAALEGREVDRCPVTSLYNQLYHLDHFAELTGLPAWRFHEWLAMDPDHHVELFCRIHETAPFELLQPSGAPTRAWRARQEFVEKNGHAFRHDLETNDRVCLDAPTRSGHATDYSTNEKQTIFNSAEVDGIEVKPASEQLAGGANDYVEAVVQRLGREEFILSGGVIGTFFACNPYLGLTNLLSLLVSDPELIEHLSRKVLLRNMERIRCLAAAGGDAIYLDDAAATSDMISPEMYRRFSLPYMKAMVDEIHRLGHKAIVIYFGGVMDRLELIAATGADGFSYEASMKGYVNDTAEIARRIGDRMTLFSNIDPIGALQNGTDADLKAEMRRQVEAGRRARGFIISTASPITPATPLSRVRRFIELGRQLETA